jgi:hypothetical protein
MQLKPYNHFGQVAKDNQSQKTPLGMYSHTNSHILFATIFFTNKITCILIVDEF